MQVDTPTAVLVAFVAAIALFTKKAIGAEISVGFGNDSPSDYGGIPLAGAPLSVTRWRDIVTPIAEAHYLNPDVVLAIIWQESAGNPGALGSSGEIGLMQTLPSTAAEFGVTDPNLLFEPAQSIRAGVAYLKFCIDNTDSTFNSFRAYNGGVYGTFRNPALSVSYANSVMNKWMGTRGLIWN